MSLTSPPLLNPAPPTNLFASSPPKPIHSVVQPVSVSGRSVPALRWQHYQRAFSRRESPAAEFHCAAAAFEQDELPFMEDPAFVPCEVVFVGMDSRRELVTRLGDVVPCAGGVKTPRALFVVDGEVPVC